MIELYQSTEISKFVHFFPSKECSTKRTWCGASVATATPDRSRRDVSDIHGEERQSKQGTQVNRGAQKLSAPHSDKL